MEQQSHDTMLPASACILCVWPGAMNNEFVFFSTAPRSLTSSYNHCDTKLPARRVCELDVPLTSKNSI